MKNIGIRKLVSEIERLNGIDVHFKNNLIIPKCFDCSKLELPEGYYFSNNCITNKGNTDSDSCECFEITTEYSYLTDFFLAGL